MEIINFKLISNPINWLTVILMVLIFSMAADVVLRKLTNKG